MGRTQIGALKEDFRRRFGRELGEPVEQEVLIQGNPDCRHPSIFYIDNKEDGQHWRCDDCQRYERMGYSPGFKIKFPANALISTPNPEYGGPAFYAWKANGKGEVEKNLPEQEWVRRDKDSLETRAVQ